MASRMWFKRSRTSGTDPLRYLSTRAIFPTERQNDQLLRQRVYMAQDLHWTDLKGHYGCVNAIEFSNSLGEYVASGGDDRRVLLWNVEKALSDIGSPQAMAGEHNSNIFCVAFDRENKSIFSGGNDEQVIVHDMKTGQTKDVFMHEDAVYGLSTDPSNPHVFASACDDGRILIYDVRESTADPFCLANYASSMHSVVYNPIEPRLLATANAKEGVGLWDVRKPRSCVLRYGGSYVQQSCMSVRFSQSGDRVIALRRRLPPVLYNIHSHQPVCEFDHSGYYNSCTMKSVCFAGDNDQYVLSGSDEFNLYMWAIPEDLSERLYINSAHMVLKGHRSIVNQVRFNPANHLVMSSGVEKVIKIWSPFRLPSKKDHTTKDLFGDRPVYTHEEYINLVLQDGHVMSHDYSQESMDEDPRMMAFFDSLVQRELEGWSSDDELSSNEEEMYNRIVQLSQSDVVSSDMSPSDRNDDSDDDSLFSPFTIAFASVMADQASEGNDRYPRLQSALARAESSHSYDRGSNADRGVTLERGASNRNESVGQSMNSARKQISKLVQKKKMELRSSENQNRKKSHTVITSTSESSDEESEGNSSGRAQSIRKKKTCQKTKLPNCSPEEISIPGCSSQMEPRKNQVEKNELVKMENEHKRQTQMKLKRFRSLRNRILNSDSEVSDFESNEKQQKKYTGVLSSKSSETLTFNKGKQKQSKYEGHTSDFGPYLHEMINPGSSNGSDLNPFMNTLTNPISGTSTNRTDLTVYTSICEKIDKDIQETKSEFRSFKNDNKRKRTNSLRDFCTSMRMLEDYDPSVSPAVTDDNAGPTYSICDVHNNGGKEDKTQKCSREHNSQSKNIKPSQNIEDSGLSDAETQPTQTKMPSLKQTDDSILDKFISNSSPYCELTNQTMENIYPGKCDMEKLLPLLGQSNSKIISMPASQSTSETEHAGQSTSEMEPSCSYLNAAGSSEGNEDSDTTKLSTNRSKSHSDVGDNGDADSIAARPFTDHSNATTDTANVEDLQPTWTEFKRFKNRMERAHRHYRKQKDQRRSHQNDQD